MPVMSTSRFVMIVALCVSMMLAGCARQQPLEAPEVHISDLSLQQAGLFEQRWQITLRVSNPNERTIRVNTLDYEVFVNDSRFARGLNGEPFELAGMSDTLVTTTVSTRLLLTLQQWLQMQDEDVLNYRLEGRARVAGYPLPLRFEQKGDIVIPELY